MARLRRPLSNDVPEQTSFYFLSFSKFFNTTNRYLVLLLPAFIWFVRLVLLNKHGVIQYRTPHTKQPSTKACSYVENLISISGRELANKYTGSVIPLGRTPDPAELVLMLAVGRRDYYGYAGRYPWQCGQRLCLSALADTATLRVGSREVGDTFCAVETMTWCCKHGA